MIDKKNEVKAKKLYVSRRDNLNNLVQPDVNGNEIQGKGINLHFDDFFEGKRSKKKDSEINHFDENIGMIDELH